MAKPIYSDAEQELFDALGMSHLMEFMDAHWLYQEAVKIVFMGSAEGSAVEALRRGFNAMQSCRVYRMTPEFDALISIK
jgi:hypothetical protein